ncbi:unnamed protein product, partial [Symbiodinium pilosum]
MLAASVSLQYMSVQMVEASSGSAWAFSTMAAVTAIFVITPRALWKKMAQILQKVAKVAIAVGSSVYAAVTWPWPRVLYGVQTFLQLPPLVWMYEVVVYPSWQILSPLFKPIATASIACASFRSLLALMGGDVTAAE